MQGGNPAEPGRGTQAVGIAGPSPHDIVFSLDWRPRIGGAHLWLEQVYRRWPGEVSVLCATPADGEAHAGSAIATGFSRVDRGAVPIAAIGIDVGTLGRFLDNALRLRRLAGVRPARIHCKCAFPEGVSALLAIAWPRPRHRLVVYAHGEDMLVAGSSRLLSWLTRAVLARADVVIANSESTRRLVRDMQPRARVVVIHPGVEPADGADQPPAGRARAELGLPSEGAVVIGIGRLEPRKNHRRVIEALSRLRAEGIEATYVCVGEGEERAAIERTVLSLGAGDWVRLLGAVDDARKQQLLAAADLFVMPSVRHGEMIEGFGIVFMEAAAAGLPSIAGEVGGQGEAVRHGETGLVVDGTRVDLIADALRALIRDPQRRAAMGLAGRAWAQEHAWSKVVARTIAALGPLGAP